MCRLIRLILRFSPSNTTKYKAGWDLIPGNKDVSTPPPSNQALLRGSARSTVCALSFSRWALNETQSLDNGESRCAALSGTLSSPLGKLRNWVLLSAWPRPCPQQRVSVLSIRAWEHEPPSPHIQPSSLPDISENIWRGCWTRRSLTRSN